MFRRLFLVASLFMAFGGVAQTPQERVVAVGDVHGNLDGFVAILQKASLIDNSRRWIGGRATLVQTGDLVDRGPKSREVLDFLIALQKEAADRGGRVRVSLGNHEVMNIMGDMRYVVAEDYAAFTDNRSAEKRQTAFAAYSRLAAKNGSPVDEAEWMKSRPPGFVEIREAYSPSGKYGKWLRTLPAVESVEDSIFLHGGLNPSLKMESINQINSAIRSELQAFDTIHRYMEGRQLALPFFTLDELVKAATAEMARLKSLGAGMTDEDRNGQRILETLLQSGGWLSVNENGPLWFRGYDSWSDAEGDSQISPLLDRLKVKRIVVGHTIQPNGQIRSRFGGKVFLIDTALWQGHSAALEIIGTSTRTIY